MKPRIKSYMESYMTPARYNDAYISHRRQIGSVSSGAATWFLMIVLMVLPFAVYIGVEKWERMEVERVGQ